jgi:hypothetical protein
MIHRAILNIVKASPKSAILFVFIMAAPRRSHSKPGFEIDLFVRKSAIFESKSLAYGAFLMDGKITLFQGQFARHF